MKLIVSFTAALALLAEREDRELKPPPRTSMFGALLAYLREADVDNFQPDQRWPRDSRGIICSALSTQNTMDV